MANDPADALDEVIREFGRRLLEDPARLRAALSDILVGGDAGRQINALVIACATGVASGIDGLPESMPVTEALVKEWFERLTTAGLSPAEAAWTTTVWARSVGSVGRAQAVSEISRTLTAPTVPDAAEAAPTPDEATTDDAADADRRGGLDDLTEMSHVSGTGRNGELTVIGRDRLETTPEPGPQPEPEASPEPEPVPEPGRRPESRRVLGMPLPAAIMAGVLALLVVIVAGGVVIVGALSGQRPEAGAGGAGGHTGSGAGTSPGSDSSASAGGPSGLFGEGELSRFPLTTAELNRLVPNGTSVADASAGTAGGYHLWFVSKDPACRSVFLVDVPEAQGASSLQISYARDASDPWLYVDTASRWFPAVADATTAMMQLVPPDGCATLTAQNSDQEYPATVVSWPIRGGEYRVDHVRIEAGDPVVWTLDRDCFQLENVVSCAIVSGTGTEKLDLGAVDAFTMQDYLDKRWGGLRPSP